MSASRISAFTTLNTTRKAAPVDPSHTGLNRRGHYLIVQYTNTLTISSLRPNVNQLQLKPTSSNSHTKPSTVLNHYHSNMIFYNYWKFRLTFPKTKLHTCYISLAEMGHEACRVVSYRTPTRVPFWYRARVLYITQQDNVTLNIGMMLVQSTI